MSNNIKVSIPLSGLFKRENYTYIFRGMGGNWPAIISPLSGAFEAKGKTETLNAMVSFCPTTGLCPPTNPNVLPFSLQGCGFDNNNLFTNIAVDLTCTSDNTVSRSSNILVECGNSCLPQISIDFLKVITATSGSISGSISGVPSGFPSNILAKPGDNTYDFISKISGLLPNTAYDYSIRSLGGNWPAVMITPLSGTFRSPDETYDLNHKLMFCPTTGLCPSNTRGYLSYTPGQCFSDKDLSTSIELRITPQNCASEQFFSNQLTLHCKDCLPRLIFDTPSTVTLTTSNSATVNTTIKGLIPGRTYNYAYSNISSSWPTIISPYSGHFTANKDSYTITSRVLFCPNTGLCPNNTSGLMLPYTLYNTTNNLVQEMFKDLMVTNIKLSAYSTTCDSTVYNSEPITLRCIDCLPDHKYPSVAFNTSSLTLTTGCCSGTYPLIVNFGNIYPGDIYTYQFTSTNSHVVFSPSSGSVSYGSGNIHHLNTILYNSLSKNERAIVNVTVTHKDTQLSDTSFMTISCSPSC